MMWLRNDGSMWRKMIRSWLAPASSAAMTKSSSRSDEEFAAHDAREIGPAEQRDDQRDREIDLQTLQSFGSAAARPIQSGMVGIERRTSIRRWIDRVDHAAVDRRRCRRAECRGTG